MQKRSESYSERFLVDKISEELDISVLVDKIWELVDKIPSLVDKVGSLVDISSCLVDKTSILVDIPWLVDKNPYVVENLQVSGHFPCGPILIPILVHIPFL